jgi:sporulation protein YlmC with PRC-barrel domain
MLRSIKDLQGFNIQATDGEIGELSEIYFDDHEWIVRYLVIDIGAWLPEQKVLISSGVTIFRNGPPDILRVNLSKDQVEKNIDLAKEKPISYYQAEDMLDEETHQPPLYRLGGGLLGEDGIGLYSEAILENIRTSAQPASTKSDKSDPHLRSSQEVFGYYIQARDGDIGHVEDFIIEDKNWTIQYMVVDTQNWIPGKKVLVAPTWIEQVDWDEAKVLVDLKEETIRNSPEYDPSSQLNRQYETDLHDHYERPKYWEDSFF